MQGFWRVLDHLTETDPALLALVIVLAFIILIGGVVFVIGNQSSGFVRLLIDNLTESAKTFREVSESLKQINLKAEATQSEMVRLTNSSLVVEKTVTQHTTTLTAIQAAMEAGFNRNDASITGLSAQLTDGLKPLIEQLGAVNAALRKAETDHLAQVSRLHTEINESNAKFSKVVSETRAVIEPLADQIVTRLGEVFEQMQNKLQTLELNADSPVPEKEEGKADEQTTPV